MTKPALTEDEKHWRTWRDHWQLRKDVVYLNHGSFGPPPVEVTNCQRKWQSRMNEQPMDFFFRQYEPAWRAARKRLAGFVGTDERNLAFVENATMAMNVVAHSFSLAEGDEVLLTDHEYGAVVRIWQRACEQANLAAPRVAPLPEVFESADQVVDSIFAHVTDRTRLIVVSHITSPTAVALPVKQICQRARDRGVAVCVDGPHAPAQAAVSIDAIGCDFYAASLHKWVSAPFGSGFLFAAPRWHDRIRPPHLSWGRLLPNKPAEWFEEFIWTGTRDSSAYLAVPEAIDFLERVGLEAFRARTHELARYARDRVCELTGLTPPIPDSEQWYGSMIGLPLPDGDAKLLQTRLFERYRIETPIVDHKGKRSVRVSCHLYNTTDDIDCLVEKLNVLLREEPA